MSITFSQPYTLTITITPVVSSIQLSSTSYNSIGPTDAGAVIGQVTLTTNPPGGSYVGPVTLTGPDASNFALSNNGIVPCDLVIGANNVPAGTYNITLQTVQ